jgi:aquaporin Z
MTDDRTMPGGVSAGKLLAELLGTYVLVLVGATAILATGATEETAFSAKVLAIAFGFGLALLAGLYAFGEVSGGHFNPAVSLAMLIDGRIGFPLTIQYWVAQIAGGILAGYTVLLVTSKAAVASTATVATVDLWKAFLLEAAFTAIFLVVILQVTKSAALAPTVFLAISLTLVVIHVALVPFTGSSVNPARSLGSGVAGGVWTDQWIYWVAPLVGAVVAWGIHKAVTAEVT